MTVQQNQEPLSMIERVAKAISAAQTQTPDMWQAFLPEARAAIEAMREPTEEMVWSHEVPHYGPDEAREAWRAMIDAAMKETNP